MIANLVQDVRYSLRQLRKTLGFTTTVVLTLALGIGANAAIFTLLHAVLLRNLPVVDPNNLVRVGDSDDCCVIGGMPENNDYYIFSYDLYKHLRDNSPEFEQLAAMQASAGNSFTARRSTGDGLPHASRGEFVSGNYFLTLGLRPFAGRMLLPADDAENAPMVAVLSYQAWQRDYGLDPSVVGSTFVLNTHPMTIVGITPPSFYGDRISGNPPDFFAPLSTEPALSATSLLHRPDLNWVYLLGRVKPGADLASLQAKMSGNLRQWLTSLPVYTAEDAKKELARSHLVLTTGGLGITTLQRQFGSGLRLLMAISALVLLIACANIANLVLARGMARRAETSIRMALGATRRTIIRQMLTESLVLSCIGGFAGLAAAYAGTRLLLSMAFPDSQNLPIHASPSPAVLSFAFALSLLTGLIFGIAPAWITSHSEPVEALRGSNRSTRNTSSAMQRSLVVLQAALSLVLLVGAGLLTKSLNKLEHQDFGLQTTNRVVIHISPVDAGYRPEQLQALYEQIEQNFQSLPGVRRVGLSNYAPLDGNNWEQGVFIQGRSQPGSHENIGASWTRVSPDFFNVIGQRVLRGRGITPQDTASAPMVAVVNQAFVKKFFRKGEDPIGRRFGIAGVKSSNELEIVGVVSDVKYNSVRRPMRAMHFRPLLQHAPISDGVEAGSLYAGAIILELKDSAEGLESQARHTLANINPNLTVVNYETFESQINGRFNQDRLVARLTLMFSLLALVLASVGLYGVTAYTVARRTAEIGIRMALGAERGSVMRMVMRGAMIQAALGLAMGAPIALFCVRFVKAQLYEGAGANASVFVGAIVTLAAATCVAGLVPARRAASIDPQAALRHE